MQKKCNFTIFAIVRKTDSNMERRLNVIVYKLGVKSKNLARVELRARNQIKRRHPILRALLAPLMDLYDSLFFPENLFEDTSSEQLGNTAPLPPYSSMSGAAFALNANAPPPYLPTTLFTASSAREYRFRFFPFFHNYCRLEIPITIRCVNV